MAPRRAGALFALAVGCGGESEEEVAAAMTSALETAHLAVTGILVVDELLTHVHETPDLQLRHGAACGCPCTDRAGTPPDTFVMTLEYGASGCYPDSGLLPSILSDLLLIDVDGETVDATLDGVLLNYEHPLSGRLQGTVDPSTLAVAAEGAMSLGPERLELDVTVDNAEAVTLSGTVGTPSGAVTRFERVTLPRDRIGPPCPTPTVGRVVVGRPDEPDVVIDLAQPGDGSVTTTRDNRVSEAVPWCSFDTELL